MAKQFKVYLNQTFITSVNSVIDLHLAEIITFMNKNNIRGDFTLNLYENELKINLYGDTFTKVLSELTHIYMGA